MSGQLSPDGNYYWDGAAWQPMPAALASRGGTTGPVVVVVALAVVAALIIAVLGVWVGVRLLSGEQRNLQSAFGPACATNGMPGARIGEGDTLCGRKLGHAVTSVDCTTATSLPSDLEADHIAPTSNDWTAVDMGMDAAGCQFVVEHHEIVEIGSTDVLSPDVTLVADFAAANFIGSVGLRLGCTDHGCVDIALYSDSTWELDEETRDTNWKELDSGSLPQASMQRDGENRLILRFVEGVATVYLNGHQVARATPDLTQASGYFGFYAENEESSLTEHVQLRRLFAFNS